MHMQKFHYTDVQKLLVKDRVLSAITQQFSRCASGQWCPSWIVPDNPYFISCRVMGSMSPEVSTCQAVTSQRPHKENEFVDVCQKPTHLPLLKFLFQFLFQWVFFFFMTSISGLQSRQL